MPSASRQRRRKQRWRRKAKFFSSCSCFCQTTTPGNYYGGFTRVCVVATTGQLVTDNVPNVAAFDQNGNLLWTYNTGFFVGSSVTSQRIVDGICRDGAGNFYLSYSVGAGLVVSNYDFGIIKLDKNGNFLQQWTPSGWTLALISSKTIWNATTGQFWQKGSGGQAMPIPQTLWYDAASNCLFWQHSPRLNGSVYDVASKLDLNFNELASYGGSNYASPGSFTTPSNCPTGPGQIAVAPDGGVWSEYTLSGSASLANLTKYTQAGVKVFNVSQATGIGRGGYSTNCPPGRNTFAIAPEKGTQGYVAFSASPDWIGGAFPQSGSDQNLIGHNSSGVTTTWCQAVWDFCNNVIMTTPPNVKNTSMCMDNAIITNATGQTPVFQKTYCDYTLAGERLLSHTSFCPSDGMAYGGGVFLTCWPGYTNSSGWGVRSNAPCTPSPAPTYSSKYSYGLVTVDAGTGNQQAMVEVGTVLNFAPGVQDDYGFISGHGSECQGPQHFGIAGGFIVVGNYCYNASPSKIPRPTLLLLSGGLSTIWMRDLSSTGSTGMGNVATVSATYADNN